MAGGDAVLTDDAHPATTTVDTEPAGDGPDRDGHVGAGVVECVSKRVLEQAPGRGPVGDDSRRVVDVEGRRRGRERRPRLAGEGSEVGRPAPERVREVAHRRRGGRAVRGVEAVPRRRVRAERLADGVEVALRGVQRAGCVVDASVNPPARTRSAMPLAPPDGPVGGLDIQPGPEVAGAVVRGETAELCLAEPDSRLVSHQRDATADEPVPGVADEVEKGVVRPAEPAPVVQDVHRVPNRLDGRAGRGGGCDRAVGRGSPVGESSTKRTTGRSCAGTASQGPCPGSDPERPLRIFGRVVSEVTDR